MKRGDFYAVGLGLFLAVIIAGGWVTAGHRVIRDDLRAAAADRARIHPEAAADRAAMRSEAAAVLRALVERVTRLESAQRQCSAPTRAGSRRRLRRAGSFRSLGGRGGERSTAQSRRRASSSPARSSSVSSSSCRGCPSTTR